ncbi:lysophospholipid acyltransferase 1-like isoform X2 [Lineus longissimus]|uniref:lysophospholipid acyltransferase 1-like isoform X2 n=1 Tax=Lineus longissimus TaxID=88925 RepID=UPI00315CC1D7
MSTVKHTSGFYAGSRVLEPLGEFTGLPIDQINFITCQFLALSITYPFRVWLHPSNTGTAVRHLFELGLGIAMTAFCFGQQMLHLLAQSTLCFLIMYSLPIEYMHIVTFIAAMSYLAITHIYRQIYDYGGYTLDITGPLMIMTQKLTSLAFSYHDGAVKKLDSLSKDQQQQMIKKLPTTLEFYSYMFYFHGIMCGPLSFFNDYIAFVNGTNFTSPIKDKYAIQENGHCNEPIKRMLVPSVCIMKKLLTASVAAAMMCYVVPYFEPERLLSKEFFQMSFFGKFGIMYMVMVMVRQKYYFAWTLAEAVNYNAGLGFSGFDEKGDEKWDLIKSVSIWKVEMGTSFKLILDNWNITTLVWLRRVVYDRAPFQKTFAVFLVSAFWHGFYPGYYFMFLSAALFTVVARQVRRNIRPYFQTTPTKAFIYDCVTWAATRIGITYITCPFVILEMEPALDLYNSIFWCVHIVAFAILLVLPHKQSSRQSTKSTEGSKVNPETKTQEVNANDGNFIKNFIKKGV